MEVLKILCDNYGIFNCLVFGNKIAVYHVPKVSLMKGCKKCGCIVLFSVMTILYSYFAAGSSASFRLCTVCSNVSIDFWLGSIVKK